MIINFSVQNYGSIKEKQTISFEANKSTHLEDYYVIHTNGLRLLKLALIYGANASGKTTILEALDFLRTLVLNPKMQKTETFNFEPFLFDDNTPQQNTVFEIEFFQNDIRYFYEVESNKEAIIKEKLDTYNSKKSNVFKRTTDLQSKFTKIEFGNKVKMSKNTEETLENNTLWNNTVLGGFLKTNVESKELKDAIDWFYNYLTSTIYTQINLDSFVTAQINSSKIKKETLIRILKKADYNISNILMKENELAVDLEFEHTVGNSKYLLPFKKESQGTQRYYGFAGILSLLIENSILFSIDELESSLHPDLFQYFLLSFLVNSKKSQLIATTHNREILNDKDIFRNDAIWITDKDNEENATELYSLADFDTKIIRNTTNILNAYKLGKLGGVPILGDYYIDVERDEKE